MVRLGEQRTLLAHLPEATFFSRYREPLLRRLRIENLVLIREAELEPGAGLNAITGETGAGKTILAQAIGLLLGAKGDAAFVGPGADEAYVEAEFELPAGLLEEDELEALAELRPEDEEGARPRAARVCRRPDARLRVGPERGTGGPGRRSGAADRDVRPVRAAAARAPAYQLDVLDAFAGEEQLRLRAELRLALARARRGSPAARRAEQRRRGRGVAARRAARARGGHGRADGRRRTRCVRSGSGSGT